MPAKVGLKGRHHGRRKKGSKIRRRLRRMRRNKKLKK